MHLPIPAIVADGIEDANVPFASIWPCVTSNVDDMKDLPLRTQVDKHVTISVADSSPYQQALHQLVCNDRRRSHLDVFNC